MARDARTVSFQPTVQMQHILDRLLAIPAVDLRSLPIAEARRRSDAASMPWNEGSPACPTRDLTIPCGTHSLAARLYAPEPDAATDRVTIYLHGGGWTFGSIATHDGLMRRLALASAAPVLGVDYRLAPEHPFPAGFDDALAAITFVVSGGLGAPIPPERVALGGDSAGATLALAALLRRRDEGATALAGAALFYGCYLPTCDTASHHAFGDGRFLLRTDMMRWYWSNFRGASGDAPGLVAPLETDLAGLPPLYLAAAGLDPLRDDTLQLADKLARAGVPTRCDHAPGVVHGCLRMARDLEGGAVMLSSGAAFLAQRLRSDAA